MKDVLVLVATGFEDTELISTVNVLKRNQVSYDLVSIEDKNMIKGQNEAIVKTQKLKEINTNNYKSIFLPGGKGHKLMLTNDNVLKIVKSYKDKFLFAICAAPAVLLAADVIDNSFTSYPGFAIDSHNTGKSIEITDKMVTANNFTNTIEFAENVVQKLKHNL